MDEKKGGVVPFIRIVKAHSISTICKKVNLSCEESQVEIRVVKCPIGNDHQGIISKIEVFPLKSELNHCFLT